MQACNRIVKQATCPIRASTVSAVSRTLADPDEKNCAELMYGSHALCRIRALGQSAIVRTAGCSCSHGPELTTLQYVLKLLMRGSEMGPARTGSSLHHTGVSDSPAEGTGWRQNHNSRLSGRSFFFPRPACDARRVAISSNVAMGFYPRSLQMLNPI